MHAIRLSLFVIGVRSFASHGRARTRALSLRDVQVREILRNRKFQRNPLRRTQRSWRSGAIGAANIINSQRRRLPMLIMCQDPRLRPLRRCKRVKKKKKAHDSPASTAAAAAIIPRHENERDSGARAADSVADAILHENEIPRCSRYERNARTSSGATPRSSNRVFRFGGAAPEFR